MEITHRSTDGVKSHPRPKKALGHEVVAKPRAGPRENCCSSCPLATSTMTLAKRAPEFPDQSAGVALAKDLHYQKQSDLVSRNTVDILRCADLLQL